jgi:hypothetical protein
MLVIYSFVFLRISDNKLRRIVKLSEGAQPNKEILDERCCFVIDSNQELYVWVGKKAGVFVVFVYFCLCLFLKE